MKDTLFTLEVKRKPFYIALIVIITALVIAGIVTSVILYKPWYNGKWNGDFQQNACLSITKSQDDLRILQISDLHVDHTNNQHDLIWKNLKNNVMKSDIDLTVITGDWTSAEDNLPVTEKLIEIMDGCKKPWAVVFGNHDSQGNASRDELAELFLKSEYCLFAKGPEELSGTGNYVINVYNNENPKHLDASLVMMDSHTDTSKSMHYEPIYRDQVKWYEKNIIGLNGIYKAQTDNKSDTVPSLLFLHIPLNEYEDAWDLGKIDTAKHIHGSNNEDVYSPDINTGLFGKIEKLSSTKGVFCGHDHANTSAVEYNGVVLAYAVQSGVCESDPFAQKLQKGGNLITLAPDGTLTVEHIYNEFPYEIIKDE